MAPRGGKNRRLIEELFRGKNCQEELVKASPEDKNTVRCIIKGNFFNRPHVTVKSINTVKNNFMEAMYLMKKAEMESIFNLEPSEIPLIHCTSEEVAKVVAKDNFNWRKVKRALYGSGISFSNDARYADKYANYSIGNHRAFIISKVLVTKSVVGKDEQDLPEEGYDTTTSEDKSVYVKYYDNEVLPLYIVYYTSLEARPNIKSGQVRKYTQNRYRLQDPSTRSYMKRTAYNPHKPRVPKRDIRHVRVKQNDGTTQPCFSLDAQTRDKLTLEEPTPRTTQSRVRSAIGSLFKWAIFTIISVTISLLLFNITNQMF